MLGARASFKGKGQQGQIIGTGKVSGWLRLAASTPVGGEWTSVTDVLNSGSPMTQTDTDRRCATGSSANGLPTMVFDGTDMYLLPVLPAFGTTKLGLMFWFKPASLVGLQSLYFNRIGVGGSTVDRIALRANNAGFHLDVFQDNVPNGRQFDTAAGLMTVGTWHNIYMQYDSSRGGDANMALILDGTNRSLTPGAIGAGTPTSLGVLQTGVASAVVGSFADSDAGSSAILSGGEYGPNMFILNDNLTTAEQLLLRTFEAPT